MNHHRTCQCRETRQHPEKAAYVWYQESNCGSYYLSNEGDSSLRCRHECGFGLGEPISSNDKRVEIGDSGIGDGLSNYVYSYNPVFGIAEDFKNMCYFP